MQITKEGAHVFMRWVIVLALFSGIIYQSTRLEVLRDELNRKNAAYEILHKDWLQAERDYANAANNCQPQ